VNRQLRNVALVVAILAGLAEVGQFVIRVLEQIPA